jgi:hypothetical protein
MATQLLGANASLNAPGGKPGAAPTVLQGALVTGGGANVNGTLTVTQPLGGGVRTAFFTDGNSGVTENSIGFFTDQADTTIAVRDNGVQGEITFNGGAQLGLGEFAFSRPIKVGALFPETTGLGAGIISMGDLVNPSSLRVTQTNQAGAVIASFTDGQVGVAENTINLFTSINSSTIQFRDNARNGELSFEGALPPGTTTAAGGLFALNKPLNIPSVVTATGVAVPEGFSSGTATIDAAGGSFGAITVPGVTNTSVIMVTPIQDVGSWWIRSRGPGVFQVQWTNGAASPTFMWHIVAY